MIAAVKVVTCIRTVPREKCAGTTNAKRLLMKDLNAIIQCSVHQDMSAMKIPAVILVQKTQIVMTLISAQMVTASHLQRAVLQMRIAQTIKIALKEPAKSILAYALHTMTVLRGRTVLMALAIRCVTMMMCV